jgi:hypothetical protein
MRWVFRNIATMLPRFASKLRVKRPLFFALFLSQHSRLLRTDRLQKGQKMRRSLFKFFAISSAIVFSMSSLTTHAADDDDAEEKASSGNTVLDSRPLPRADVPDPLKSWIPWVLKDQPALSCPFAYNASQDRRCVWPGKVALALNGRSGGTFSYQVDVFAAAYVDLPGSEQAWPQAVMANGKPIEVTGSAPRVLLPVGSHKITGSFVWSTPPESLSLPNAVGLVELTMNGKTVAQPNLGDNGQLWLAQDADGSDRATASQLTVRINRLIDDTIPARVTTQLELVASGKNQEVVLPNAVLNGFIPIELKSGLPARVEADGKLRVQVRAGRWEIMLVARNQETLMSLASPFKRTVDSITATAAPTPTSAEAKSVAAASPTPATASPNKPSNIVLPTEEVWAFQAHNELRLVTPEGLAPVDPAQTTLPQAWRRFPSFVVQGNDTLKLNESKRGDPQPAPDRLALRRNIWLDFDGRGYTVQDNISGSMNSSWRMEMPAPSVLGRAAVAGADQFITALADPKKPAGDGNPAIVGIEVRRGQASVIADSRIETDSKKLSAVGWRNDFNSVAATLHLPPGWRLIATQGTDASRTAWVAKWTLLDLFLLLMVALSFGRLFGVKWGVIALAGITLAYHEVGVPIAPWLVALGAIALIRVLPKDGKFAKFVQAGRVLALLAVALTLLPFMVSQVRQAMYPVLEKKIQTVYSEEGYGRNRVQSNNMNMEMQQAPVAAAVPAPEVQMEIAQKRAEKIEVTGSKMDTNAVKDKSWMLSKQNAQFRLDNYDSKAMIQTGPGLPGWTWNSHELTWSGPVEQSQQLSLWLVSPFWNSVLRILCVVLLGAMLLCILELIKRWPIGLTPKSGEPFYFASLTAELGKRNTAASAAILAASAVAMVALSLTKAPSAQAQLPTPELLDQLKGRLTVAPSCLPQCASIPRMSVNAAGDAISLRLEIHASEDVAVPLPGGAKEWRAQQVLVNGKAASALQRDSEGTLWVQVLRGVQQVQLIGTSNELDVIAFALPLKPNRVDSQLNGWTLDGVSDNGQADNSLTLSRVAGNKKRADGNPNGGDAKQGSIAPFFLVERTLSLGLQWQVTTRVVRLSPSNTPASLEVALLDGESITTPEPRAEKGKALVSMAPQTTEVVWESTLKESPEVTLVASKQSNQFEVWQLNPGTQWHFTLSGIAVTAHQEDSRWSPKWQPWPGETVKIAVSRPTGVQGQTLTVDGTLVTVKPGSRATDTTFTTTLRSSRGGQHVILLPEGAALQNVDINGQSQPIRLVGREVRLPLVPGTQQVKITWREATGIGARFTTPQVNVNAPSVNARIQLIMPSDRWTLFVGGPAIGPAVLIWGVLIVMIAVAYALGRVKLTPLKMLQWALLGIGFTQVHPIAGAIFVGWLFILGIRKTHWPAVPNWLFNLGQIAIVGWTAIALAILVWSVSRGLLGSPNMQIAGNGATAQLLSWFADRAGPELPTAWVISVPLWLYRGLMLLWALWLAYALLQWLKWGWTCFTKEGYWRALEKKPSADRKATKGGVDARNNNQADDVLAENAAPQTTEPKA